MRPDMHARRVEPDKKWFAVLDGFIDEFLFGVVDLHVNGRHAFAGERAGVLNLLSALAVGPRVQHPARAVLLFELRVFWVIISLRLLLGIQVIEIAKELIETVYCWEVRVPVAKMILSELTCC